jgi:hypothetical protein
MRSLFGHVRAKRLRKNSLHEGHGSVPWSMCVRRASEAPEVLRDFVRHFPKDVPQGLNSLCENYHSQFSPEGTAECSPGR